MPTFSHFFVCKMCYAMPIGMCIFKSSDTHFKPTFKVLIHIKIDYHEDQQIGSFCTHENSYLQR